MSTFQPGDQVFWWKRISRQSEYPYRAEIVTIGPKRVAISVEEPDDASIRFTRHVATESLQHVCGYYVKAPDQGPYIREPAATWGRFTRYIEIGEDLRAIRQVDEFENGNLLSYDRTHWVDNFGMLGDARINRNRKRGLWGLSEEIEAFEFERVWTSARAGAQWPQQLATAQMLRMGTIPIWLTVKMWHPDRKVR